MPQTVLINGRGYGFTDVQVRMLKSTRPIAGLTEINWSVEGENSFHHGTGTEPVSWTKGKNSYSGSMKLHRDEVQMIQALLPKGQPITALAPFDIILTYDTGSAKFKTERLVSVLITKHDAASASGSGVLEDTLTFVFAQIQAA